MTTFKQKSVFALLAILLVIVLRSGPAASGWQAGDKSKLSPIKLVYPNGLALDDQGDLYISDIGTHRILKLDRLGRLTVIAGTGEGGFGGDGKEALAAELNTPQKIAVAKDGSVFIADRANHRVRKVDARGFITTVVGESKRTGMFLEPDVIR